MGLGKLCPQDAPNTHESEGSHWERCTWYIRAGCIVLIRARPKCISKRIAANTVTDQYTLRRIDKVRCQPLVASAALRLTSVLPDATHPRDCRCRPVTCG